MCKHVQSRAVRAICGTPVATYQDHLKHRRRFRLRLCPATEAEVLAALVHRGKIEVPPRRWVLQLAGDCGVSLSSGDKRRDGSRRPYIDRVLEGKFADKIKAVLELAIKRGDIAIHPGRHHTVGAAGQPSRAARQPCEPAPSILSTAPSDPPTPPTRADSASAKSNKSSSGFGETNSSQACEHAAGRDERAVAFSDANTGLGSARSQRKAKARKAERSVLAGLDGLVDEIWEMAL